MWYSVRFRAFVLNNALTFLENCGQSPRIKDYNCFVEYLVRLGMLTWQREGPFCVWNIINNLSRKKEITLKKDSFMFVAHGKVMLYKQFMNTQVNK